MNKNKFLVQELIVNAHIFFGVSPSQSKIPATKFVNDGYIPKSDPVVNHGVIDHYVMEMLSKYHLLSKKQITDRA